jgi:hypothetical protein
LLKNATQRVEEEREEKKKGEKDREEEKFTNVILIFKLQCIKSIILN